MKISPETKNKIITDETLMEVIKHGTTLYPFECYFEKMSQFDFNCIEWHWHTELEFVFVESGNLTLWVSEDKLTLSEGNGVFINSQVLHRFQSHNDASIPNFLCLPSFLAHEKSLIYQKYIQPIISSSLNYKVLTPDVLWKKEILTMMKEIFDIQENPSIHHC